MSSSAFHIKRSQTSHLETLQQYNGLRTTRWVLPPPQGKSVLEIQTTHTPTALQKVAEGKNYLTPPYHCTLRECGFEESDDQEVRLVLADSVFGE